MAALSTRDAVVRTAILALADARPLHDEIKDVDPIAQPATDASRRGDLGAALLLLVPLGLDPLVARVAARVPAAALDVDRRLRAVRPPAITSALWALTYGVLLATFQVAIAVMVTQLVLPVFQRTLADAGASLPGPAAALASATSLCAPLVAVASVLVIVLWAKRDAIVARVLADYARGRCWIAASVLAAHGVAPAEAARVVGVAPSADAPGAGDLDGAGPLTLEEIGATLLAAADQRAVRISVVVRGVVVALAFAASLALLLAVYSSISVVSAAAFTRGT